MEVGSLGDLSQREPRLARALKALAATGARLIDLSLRTLNDGLRASNVRARLLLCIASHRRGA